MEPTDPQTPAVDAEREATPSSRWSAAGQPDPHGTRYDCERAGLTTGNHTDDEIANAVYLYDHRSGLSSMAFLTAAKDRIRWLSRRAERAEAERDFHQGELVTAQICFERVVRERDEQRAELARLRADNAGLREVIRRGQGAVSAAYSQAPIAIQRAGREVGPVEALCREIEFRFQRQMETPAVLIAFVRELVATVAEDRDIRVRIAAVITGAPPSEASGIVLNAAVAMLGADDPIAAASKVHDLAHELNPEDAYPTDHVIDMLSSCASAIRFGLESPCRSRHAAEAAHHIWRQHYGVSLEDSHTRHWWRDWARSMMEQALVAMATRPVQEMPTHD